MNIVIYSVLASLLVSLGSLVGIVTLFLQEDKLSTILIYFVSLSTGALLGSAFFHLLPEAVEKIPSMTAFGITLTAFLLFFIIEKVFHWRHCHKKECDVHSFGYMNLVGDGIHNFIDGIIIAGTFATSIPLGVITSVTIALHEIPQEVGDFGVLLLAGFKRKKALMANFFTALTVVAGSVAGAVLSDKIEGFISYLLPFAAGGFLYIASSDLIPEMKKTKSAKASALSFCIMLSGIALALLAKSFGER